MEDELDQIREKRMEELKKKMEAQKSGVRHVDEMHFAEFIRANPFVVVDFWAEWCGPCRRIAPVMDELAREYAGKITFAKVNTDDNRTLSVQYSISAIPAIMLFAHGQLIDRIIGAYPKEAIRQKLIQRFELE